MTLNTFFNKSISALISQMNLAPNIGVQEKEHETMIVLESSGT